MKYYFHKQNFKMFDFATDDKSFLSSECLSYY